MDADSQSINGSHSEKPQKGAFRFIIELVVIVAIVFGLSALMRAFVFSGYEIPSGSMEDTIMTGDMVFSEKITYHTRAVEAGDIITFIDPEDSQRTLIKRVIATAGQTINLHDGKLYIDGVEQDEEYTGGKPSMPLQSSITYPYTVPEDCVWVMGDNRTNSQDSRYFGAVSTSSVTGKAGMIYWPLGRVQFLN